MASLAKHRLRTVIQASFLLLCTPLWSAELIEPPNHHFHVRSGLNLSSRQDRVFSDRIYNSASPVLLGLNYTFAQNQIRHGFDFSFHLETARSQQQFEYLNSEGQIRETESSQFLGFDLNYSWLSFMQEWQIHVGVFFNWSTEILSYDFGFADDEGYLIDYSIGPTLLKEWQINNHTIMAGVSFSLLDWVARSPYAIQDDEFLMSDSDHNGFTSYWDWVGRGNLTSIHKLQKLKCQVGYSLPLTTPLSIGINYTFTFFRYIEPKTIILYRNNITVVAGFKF